MHKKYIGCLMAIVCFMLTSCKLYKFTDASVNPNLKTITVNTFPNVAPIQVPALSSLFTENLKDKFLRETSLKLATSGGDIEFNGSITTYSIDPIAISNVETVAQNRLTITIRVECINRLEPTKSFSQAFTDGENYDASQDIARIESELINTITERIIQNIFNKAFVNW